jgi:putative FmdB family regulatory protein
MMPIYEYQCEKCGYIFEEVNINKVTKLSVECPHCDGISKKIMSSSAFVIKGYSYQNGYSKEK